MSDSLEELRSQIREMDVGVANGAHAEGHALFIDVREPWEWDTGIIDNSALVSLSQLPELITHLDLAPETPIIVYCAHGNRSVYGTALALSAGFTNVVSMAGGISDWQAHGFEVVAREQARFDMGKT